MTTTRTNKKRGDSKQNPPKGNSKKAPSKKRVSKAMSPIMKEQRERAAVADSTAIDNYWRSQGYNDAASQVGHAGAQDTRKIPLHQFEENTAEAQRSANRQKRTQGNVKRRGGKLVTKRATASKKKK